jgi:acyl-coenzyme A synthetase/AMP-(fatty) acid ligase
MCDEDGYLRCVGRVADGLHSSDDRISPFAPERVCLAHAAVAKDDYLVLYSDLNDDILTA